MTFDFLLESALFDDLVLAKILAGGAAGGFQHGVFFAFTSEFSRSRSEGPACAIGAGILYIGYCDFLDARLGDGSSPLDFFASHFRVPWEYAAGVSSGFEGFRPLMTSPDFLRGYAVGAAVAAATDPKEEVTL